MTNHNIKSPQAAPVIINVETSGLQQVDPFSQRDTLSVLYNYRFTFLLSFFSVVFVFFLVFVITPKQYTFNTEVTLGTKLQFNENGIPQAVLVQQPESAKFRLIYSIIPKLQSSSIPNHTKVDVLIPGNTDVVVISSTGDTNQQPQISDAHDIIISELAKSHQRETETELDLLRGELETTQTTIKEMNTFPLSEHPEMAAEVLKLKSRLDTLKRSIALFNETHSELGTVRSVEPYNKSIFVYTFTSFVVALMLGLSLVLLRHYSSKWRK